MRNFLSTLLLSQGTPMVCAGDEFGRTQNGNNNAYCQDNEISWVNWSLNEDQLVLVAFFRQLSALFHLYPVLRRSRFFTGEINPAIGARDVTWIDANGSEMKPETWDNEMTRCFGMLLDGRAQVSGIKRLGGDVTLLIVFNAHHDVVKFKLPRSADSSGWKRIVDTNDPTLPAQKFKIGAVYEVTARSLLLFERVPSERKIRTRAVEPAG
jgi:isoamylase